MLRLICGIVCVFTVILLTSCNGAGVNAYDRGNRAYEYGDYKTAFANYLFAAEEGVVPAEYAVGYQYYYGQGTKRDQVKGIQWLIRAAHHSPRARYALELIQQRVPRQPWVLGWNDHAEKPEKTKTDSHNACLISVRCVK